MDSSQANRRVGSAGRPLKYDWDDKREACYKLYVEERKGADQIIRHFKELFQVDASDLPCPNTFLRQFKIWGFPDRIQKVSPEERIRITARIRDLWEQNTNQKDIQQILQDEGFNISNHEFGLLWKENNFRLRRESGYKVPESSNKRKQPGDSAVDVNVNEVQSSNDQPWQIAPQPQYQNQDITLGQTKTTSHEEAAMRAQRLYELQLDSDLKRQAGKRRRRIRGYAHIPADAPGSAPRYASETALDECKAYLHLSNEMYTTIRADFEVICRELNIEKKTLCAEGVWDESKNRLVRENLHLSAMLHPFQPDLEKKTIALDCICADVTKRMRASTRMITIAEANNALNLNPTESKAVRRSLYEILERNNFESRLICGEDLWNAYRTEWLGTSEKLQQAVAGNDDADADADARRLAKCVGVLCRDTVKRFREDRIRRGTCTIMHSNDSYGPGPGPAPRAAPSSTTTRRARRAASRGQRQSTGEAASGAASDVGTVEDPSSDSLTAPQPRQLDSSAMSLALTASLSFELDPALANDSTLLPAGATPLPAPSSSYDLPMTAPAPNPGPISAYFTLAPASSITVIHPKMWLGTLPTASIASLHLAATSKAGGTARVVKVYGLIGRGGDGGGGEDSWLIETDEELGVYLLEAGERVRFAVLLEGEFA